MPRKNQGLRAHHQKSKDGCSLCKHRRVKCGMQQPACANCVRREEVCQYPPRFDGSSIPLSHTNHSSMTDSYNSESIIGNQDRTVVRRQGNDICDTASSTRTIESNTTSQTTTVAVLESLLKQSWFSPPEAVLWSAKLRGALPRYQYVGHCIMSLAYLRQDLFSDPRREIGVFAYQHQVAASESFRNDMNLIDENNWIPTITFHIFTMIFLFSTQSLCTESEFALVKTMRMLKVGSDLGAQVAPYFRRSVLWEHIPRRITSPKENDPVLQMNLKALGRLIAENHKRSTDLGIQGEQSHALYEAYNALCVWIDSCAAHPRGWDQYCAWPSRLSPKFFDSIIDCNEIALLLIVYWCALLYRAPQRSVCLWAYRSAQYALSKQRHCDQWQSLLSWPLQVLAVARESSPRKTPNVITQ